MESKCDLHHMCVQDLLQAPCREKIELQVTYYLCCIYVWWTHKAVTIENAKHLQRTVSTYWCMAVSITSDFVFR